MEAYIILLAIVVAVVCFAFIVLLGIDRELLTVRRELQEIHRTIKNRKP